MTADRIGCERCNWTGVLAGKLGGKWTYYPQLRCECRMTYQEARAAALQAESAHDAACETMSAIEARLAAELAISSRGPMNLVAEPIRLHPDYRAAWAAERAAFARLRTANAFMSRHFKKEIRAEIAERRAERLARHA